MKISLDIIIPCYNAKDTLFYTLSSICIQQGIKDFKVYLINDKSDYDYKEEVDYFLNYFNIQEIKLKKNLGPGGARREGIKKSNSQYIMFIDSDDILFNVYSIRDLYNSCSDHDLCISNFIYERDNVRVIKRRNSIWLHGKIYRREFLDKYNINFNDSRANEDNGFNRLVLLMNPNINYLNKVTYVYRDNSFSITRKDNRNYKIFGLEGLVYNMLWAMNEALKRGADTSIVPFISTGLLISMYYDYLYFINDKDAYYILKYSKDILPYYYKYDKLDEDEFNSLAKEKEYTFMEEKRKFKKSITFDDFVRMVEEYD